MYEINVLAVKRVTSALLPLLRASVTAPDADDAPGGAANVSADIVNITEPIASPEVSQAIVISSEEMRTYMRDLVAHKRAHPADDIISRLLAANDGGMTDEELISHLMLLQVSAPDPTSNLLAYGTLAFARDPEQAAVLRGDPGLDANAVEEMLRYEAPLQLTGRYPTEDVEYHGQRIEAGTALVLSLASANHDEAKWGPTADDLNVRRDHVQDHLSFARGIHTCFGAQLARLQAQLTFGRMVRRFPGLKLSAPPTWPGCPRSDHRPAISRHGLAARCVPADRSTKSSRR